MANAKIDIQLSREELEVMIREAAHEFLDGADDLSSSITWNYTDLGDLDSVVVSVYVPEVQQS